MATLAIDPQLEQRLLDERHARGADHHDEVWEGTRLMTPMPNNEHQEIVSRLIFVLESVVGVPGLGRVTPGVNLAGSAENWEQDYRCPDAAVFLTDTAAEDCGSFWRGAADFVVEIISPGDRSREKLGFYEKIGVRELLLVDRDPWRLELYRLQEGRLVMVGNSGPAEGETLTSRVLPLSFRLVPGTPRPKIEVTHRDSRRQWAA